MADDSDSAIDRIFLLMDDWFQEGRFAEADAYLRTINPRDMSLIEILAYLSIMNWGPDSYRMLPNKEGFARIAIDEVRSREPVRYRRLLTGLVPSEWCDAA